MFFIFFFLIVPYATGQYDHVTEINQDYYQRNIENSNDLWFMYFYSEKYDPLDMEMYNKVGEILAGFAKFGVVNMDKEPELTFQRDISKVHTLQSVKNNTSLFEYDLPYPSKDDLIESAINVISGYIREYAQDKLVEGTMVNEFNKNETDVYAKSSGRWAVMFYTSEDIETRERLSNLWGNVAKKLREKIQFGAFDVSQLEEDYSNVYNKIPTIRYYYGVKEISDEYEGPMVIDDVYTWALDLIKRPKVHEILEETLLRDKCMKFRYCVITAMPSAKVCDLNCFVNEKNALRDFANAYKQYSWSWVIIRAGDMPLVDRILGVATKEMHVVRMVEVRTLKSKSLDNPSKEDMKNMFEDVASGKEFTGDPLRVFEHIDDKYKPWHDEL